MKYHPDRNPDAKDADVRFKEASEAYEVLADADKRQAYDQFGHAGVEGRNGGMGAGFEGNFGDIFGDIFGGGGGGGCTALLLLPEDPRLPDDVDLCLLKEEGLLPPP